MSLSTLSKLFHCQDWYQSLGGDNELNIIVTSSTTYISILGTLVVELGQIPLYSRTLAVIFNIAAVFWMGARDMQSKKYYNEHAYIWFSIYS